MRLDQIEFRPVRGAEADALIEQSSAYMLSLYPSEACYLADVSELQRPENFFIGAFADNVALGCVALLARDGYAEIKRLFVDPARRGARLGEQLMAHIEKTAAERGVARIRLETGVRQPASIHLYEKIGYQRIDAFGGYPNDPLSIFMEKELPQTA